MAMISFTYVCVMGIHEIYFGGDGISQGKVGFIPHQRI